MRKTFIYLCVIFLLSSCARGCQGCTKQWTDNQNQNIRVTFYSGGKAVKSWTFYGIVSNEEGGTAYFYYQGNLVEIEGDFIIEHLGYTNNQNLNYK